MIVMTCKKCHHYIPHKEERRYAGNGEYVITYTCISCGHTFKRVTGK